MKLVFKVENGFIQQLRFWLIRLGVVLLASFLYLHIYEINPFFVNTFSFFLLIYIFLVCEEKILLYHNYILYKKYRLFNLICLKKEYDIDEIKNIIVDVKSNANDKILEFFLFHNIRHAGEIRIIMNNGAVIKILTNLNGDDLKCFQQHLFKLKKDNSRIKQPIFRS